MLKHGSFVEASGDRLTLKVADSIAAMDAVMNGRWFAVMGMAADMEWLMELLMLTGMLLPTLGMDMSG